MRKGKLAARKSLGQHFLLDPSILNRIVALGEIGSDHTVIEVGPGPGGLTRAILQSPARQVIAVEKDRRFARALADEAAGHLTVVEADALEIDVAHLGDPPRVIIANLPYNVATPLLINWLENAASFERMVLMFQKEVAQRITASVGEKHYGRLAVMSQWVAETRYAHTISAGSFSPPPKVDSAVVTFVPKAAPRDVPWQDMETVVAAAFGQRRKMLRGALKSLGEPLSLLEAASIHPELRAEDVPVDGFVSLARAFAERRSLANSQSE